VKKGEFPGAKFPNYLVDFKPIVPLFYFAKDFNIFGSQILQIKLFGMVDQQILKNLLALSLTEF